MKVIVAAFLFFSSSIFLKAQDSTAKRILSHEIGFNTVSLIKQIVSNNPGTTLAQLPYDIFYNIYYKNLFGFRAGLGLVNSSISTELDGQTIPRTTDQTLLNLRLGFSYNFVRTQKITFNGFADFILKKDNFESSTTTISPPIFPNPSKTETVKSSILTSGVGGQLGVGVKYNIYKHLSLYAEVPLSFITEKTDNSTSRNNSGILDETKESSKKTTSRITLPTTLYLILRF